MSVDATRWAWSLAVSPSQKIVLLSMADRAGESHVCWPSVARLEADTCLDRKTILRAISELEALGLVAVNRCLGRGNSYQLLGVEGRETSTKNGTGGSFSPVPKTGLVPVPKTGLVSDGDQSQKRDTHQSQKRDTHQSQKRDTESTIEPKRRIYKAQTDSDLLPDTEDQTPDQTSATMAGAVCVALKAVGVGAVAPGNMELRALIDAGAGIDAFVEAGKKAVQKNAGFGYVLAIVRNELANCAAIAQGATDRGNTPAAGGLLPGAI